VQTVASPDPAENWNTSSGVDTAVVFLRFFGLRFVGLTGGVFISRASASAPEARPMERDRDVGLGS